MDWQDEEADISHPKPPSWVITFADLMSLLMCFFVLLLSYSEMDAQKFKQMATSLQNSLGTPLTDSTGTVIVDPIANTPQNPPTATDEKASKEPKADAPTEEEVLAYQAVRQKLEDLVKETQDDASKLAQTLHSQIQNGELEIETKGRDIIVRLREKGSFDSGSADLSPASRSIVNAVRQVLIGKPGSILVQGHTDDRPIKTARFRSNWELSAVRAVAVADALMTPGQVAQNRFEVTGLADTRPLVGNDSADNRARNRRVEIVISQDIDAALSDADKELLKKQDTDKVLRALQIQPRRKPANLPQNIF